MVKVITAVKPSSALLGSLRNVRGLRLWIFPGLVLDSPDPRRTAPRDCAMLAVQALVPITSALTVVAHAVGWFGPKNNLYFDSGDKSAYFDKGPPLATMSH